MPGSPGKKICPKCQLEVGVRKQICECGHEFESDTKTTKTKSKKSKAPKVAAIVDVVLILQTNSKAIKKLGSLDKWLESVKPSETDIVKVPDAELVRYKEQVRIMQPINAVPKRTVTAVWDHLNPQPKEQSMKSK
ncbi:MAG: hypothetical protein CMJ78_02920 [Planctomycetaceae bacterium]|nr:hypothetical protein [Planctomycetaceae bacterium]